LLNSEKSFEDLANQQMCAQLLSNLKNSFEGFVDIGLIDSDGNHRSYTGPYDIGEKNYKDQHWFQEVSLQGVYISDVFMGFRKFPHFVIATKHELDNGDFYILRVTLNTDILNKQIRSLEFRPNSDAFLINREGILQTPSRFYGGILEKYPIPVPPYTQNAIVEQVFNFNGNKNILGYAYIDKSPFILIVIKGSEDFMSNLNEVRAKVIWSLVISMLIIVTIIIGSTAYVVKRVYNSEMQQVRVLHNMEYTNKMASIGRLAAGVAHEINNPLAIINEKAGLLRDFATLKPDFKYRDKILNEVDSLLKSVDRCSAITHRLLGFAKRMDINTEVIDLELLLKDVISFLGKEAALSNIAIDYDFADNLPSIESDRGQLQQVFLNIITNAFYALEDKGRIDIVARQIGNQLVEITVADNGIGISKENLEHIFEPFFTTKGKYGTGLGLSITYGIVKKLDGEIKVKSKLGEGTSFTVTLPIKP
jgi:signal transduction histidine kinase